MKAWQIEAYGELSNLKLVDVSTPIIHYPKDVLIKVSATSVNPIDVWMIGGYGRNAIRLWKRFDKPPGGSSSSNTFPLIVGRDFTGEVIEIGKSVTDFSVGDRVWGISEGQRQGCHAEYVVVNSSNICSLPDNISNIDGASLPFVGLTGWSTVITGGIKPGKGEGKTVLVLGASGGVGTFITQLLSSWGAKVIGVCSSAAFELVRSCGAVEVHDYRNSETFAILTSEQRFDCVIDSGGQPDAKWMKALRRNAGAIMVTLNPPLLNNTDSNGIVIGLLASIGQLAKPNLCSLTAGQSYKWAFIMPDQQALKEIAKLTSESKIRPIVDKIYSFDEAPAAYEHMTTGKPKGKIVIDLQSLPGKASVPHFSTAEGVGEQTLSKVD